MPVFALAELSGYERVERRRECRAAKLMKPRVRGERGTRDGASLACWTGRAHYCVKSGDDFLSLGWRGPDVIATVGDLRCCG